MLIMAAVQGVSIRGMGLAQLNSVKEMAELRNCAEVFGRWR